MTDKKERPVLKEFIAMGEEISGLEDTLRERKNEFRDDQSNKQRKTYETAAYNYAKAVGLTALSRDNYSLSNPQLREEITNHFNLSHEEKIRNRSNHLQREIELISKQLKENTLDALIESDVNPENKNPVLLPLLKDRDSDLLQKHLARIGAKAQVKRYESGNFASDEEKQQYINDAATGYAMHQKDLLKKDKKRPQADDFIDKFHGSSRRAVELGLIERKDFTKYAVKGAKARVEVAEKAYEAAVQKAEGRTVYDAMREGIREVAKEKSESFNSMVNGLYSAYKATSKKS